jgi:hypothetical protein
VADYCTPEDIKIAFDVASTDDQSLALAVTSASRLVDSMCGRTFGVTASADRYVNPLDAYCAGIPDAATITAVASDDGADGTYSTSWSASDWYGAPVGHIGPHGGTGWPFTAIVAVGGRTFSRGTNRRPLVKVTGTWGWSAVPEDVHQATVFLAAEMFKAREAPLGTAGMTDWGPITIRGNRRVVDLLAPFKRVSAADGRFLVA